MNYTSSDIWERILEEARFAPSGDNTQPWRFEHVDALRIIVHGLSTESYCIYDKGGFMSALSIGALLETISISASRYGYTVNATPRSVQTHPEAIVSYELALEKSSIASDPLTDAITERQTNRFAFKRRALTVDEKETLARSLPKGVTVRWIEGRERDRFARMLYHTGKLKVILPEIHALYRRVIQRNATQSADRMPDRSLGLDPLSRVMMHAALKHQRLTMALASYGGMLLPRIETDLIPGYFCGAHFALTVDHYPQTHDEWVMVGRALQRFWLTATTLGLQFQPEMAVLIFSQFAHKGKEFSKYPGAMRMAQDAKRRLGAFVDIPHTVFLGRIGAGEACRARSVRLPLADLWYSPH